MILFIIAYICFVIGTYILLKTDSSYQVTIFESKVFAPVKSSKEVTLIAALFFPLSLTILIKSSMFIKTFALTIGVIILTLLGMNVIKTYNYSQTLSAEFSAGIQQRKAIYSKMTKEVKEFIHIAKLNDTSYRLLVKDITLARTANENLMWQWLREQNPNINYHEVSALYKSTMTTIKELRSELYTVELSLQNIERKWVLLHTTVPSRFFLSFQPKTLGYFPIIDNHSLSSSETGIDDKLLIYVQ